ncbi:DUF4347 domain-containing protein [Sulfuricurvum sp.]|uniref:DUF4347 domain-containing protein n=1 Tax=Sulfuricurvum sp. TaxID=2025608 RepID=UPI0035662B14
MDTVTQPQQIAFVLNNVADYQTLVAGIPAGTPVYVLNSNGDVLAQMAAITSGYSNLSAIHLLSHGSDGALNLGALNLDSANLNDYAGVLSQIGSSLSESGDILLYGCNVAADQNGVDFIGKLAQVTGADIAASNDVTGSGSLGGDWVLEKQIGQVTSNALVISDYNQILAPSTFDFTTATPNEPIQQTVNGVTVSVTTNDNGLAIWNPGSGNIVFSNTNGNSYINFAFNSAVDVSSFLIGFITNTGQVTDFTIQGFNGATTHTYNVNPTYNNLYDNSGTGPSYTVNLSGANAWGPVTSIKVTANGGGTVEFEADTIVFTLPVSAPTTTISTALFSADTGTSSTDFITKTAAQTISGTLSGVTVTGETVQVSLDNGSTWTTATNTIGQNTWSLAATLSGSNTLQARVTNAGGSSTAYTHTYTLDTTAPTTPVATMALSADTGTSSTDFISKTAVQTISGTLSGVTVAGEIVQVSLDNGTTWATATNVIGQNTWSLAGQTLLPSNILQVRVSDAAGNNGTASTQAYVLDTTAPTTTIATMALSADTGTSSTDFITKTTAQTISGTLSANLVSGEIVQVSLDNGSTWTTATTSVGANTWSLAGQTLSGSNTLQVRVSDAAGNSGTASTQAYVLDTTAPTISSGVAAQAVNDNATNSPFSAMTFTEANNVTVQITLDTAAKGSFTTLNGFTNAGGGVYTYTGTVANATTAIQGLVFTPTANRVAPGSSETTTFTVLTTDAAGNSATDAATTVISASINDAPVLNAAASPSLNGLGINPSAPSNGSSTGSTLLSALVGGITDADSAAVKGIAITATDTTNGTLYYSTNAGTTWTAGGGVAANSALLLASDANTRLYYHSNNGISGNILSALTFRAWDQTSGTAATKVDTTTNGGTTAFSTATDTVSIAIYPPPTIGGVSANQAVNDNATDQPFSAATIANAGTGNNVTVTVTLDTQAKGSFTTLSGFTDNHNGSYTLTNVTAATAQTDIRGMVFTPTANHVNPGLTETTTFTLSVSDATTAVTATDATTTVVSTSINDAPLIGGATAVTNINDTATATPFSAFTISDADTAQTQTLTVTLDTASKGALSNLSGGTYNAGTGVYTFSGTAAQAQAAIRALVFTPTANHVNPGLTETTTFTVSVNDGIAAAATNNSTTVVSTSVNDAPLVGGATAVTNINDTATATPFSAFTISDADTAQTQTLTVTLDTASKGALSNLSGGTYNAGTGVYTFSGTAAQAQSAIHALVFTPTDNHVASGASETTTFAVSVSDGIAAAATNSATTVISTNNVVPPIPSTPTTTIDGATVQTTTTTDTNGNTVDEIIIAPITSNRVDITGSASTADIPLFWGESTHTDWATTASLPTGVGLTAIGARAPVTAHTMQDSINNLIALITETAPSTDASKSNMLSGGSSFLQTLNGVTDNLIINKITLTDSGTNAPSTPITIQGTASTVATNAGQLPPVEALVIDAQALPSNTTINLNNVEFATLIGANIILNGSEGKQTIFTGDGHQDITCGPGDNEIHAGGGDDTVHSAGGNDRIFGGSGNDTVTYSGNMSDYIITRDNGKTYVQTLATGHTDTIVNAESIQFGNGTYSISNNEDLTQIVSLYQHVLGRQADLNGFQYWASMFNNGNSIGAIATDFVRSSEYFTNTNTAWDTMSNDAKIETFYQLMLGRASDTAGKSYWMDAINHGMSIQEVAGNFVNSVEMQGTYTTAQNWNFIV